MIEGDDFRAGERDGQTGFIPFGAGELATTFGGEFAAGAVDEDLAHGTGGGAEEVDAVFVGAGGGVDEFEVEFVDDGGGLGVEGGVAGEAGGEAAEVFVDEGDEEAVGLVVAGAPAVEELGDFVIGRGRG